MIYTYNKLIRDNLIEIMEKKGHKVKYRILEDEEYLKELEKKLQEEVNEYLESKEIEEIADILEVIYALMECHNITKEEIEKIRIDKSDKKGAFNKKIFLIDVEED